MGEPHPGVTFPTAQAEDVVRLAQGAITQIAATASKRQSLGAHLRPHWTGNYADQFFGTELPRMTNDAANLTSELQNLISTVQNAVDTAGDWQHANKVWQANKVKQFFDGDH